MYYEIHGNQNYSVRLVASSIFEHLFTDDATRTTHICSSILFNSKRTSRDYSVAKFENKNY